MSFRKKSQAKSAVHHHPDVIFTDEESILSMKGNWCRKVFQNQKPLFVEFGIGRGRFIVELAQKNPDANYLGIELKEERLLSARRKIEESGISNVKLLWINVFKCAEIFGAGELDGIYINFPDPWPKKRHTKRRMIHMPLLETYRNILKPNAFIVLKTDNRNFFLSAKENLSKAGWTIQSESENLPDDEKNIPTEFEIKFRTRGTPIYILIFANTG